LIDVKFATQILIEGDGCLNMSLWLEAQSLQARRANFIPYSHYDGGRSGARYPAGGRPNMLVFSLAMIEVDIFVSEIGIMYSSINTMLFFYLKIFYPP
jgi:hypothetical protein